MNGVKDHPFTAAAALTGLAALVVWLFEVFGLNMPTAVSAVVAGVIVSLGLAIRKYGIKGLVTTAWRGEKKNGE